MAGKSDACFSGISAAPGRQMTKVAPMDGVTAPSRRPWAGK
ncbi:hypothetical protein [Vreelandella nigrificans]|nr:hypothetical protein [Halomonas nigrificans]